MLLQEITMEMKASVEEIRKKYHHTVASYAFASLYVWQEELGLSIHLEKDLFLVRRCWKGETAWYFPCGEGQLVRQAVENLLHEKDLLFCFMREEDVAFLQREFPGHFQFTEKESDHEYLYDRAEQVSLQGKRFVGLRNDIHRIERLHTLSWEPLCADNVKDALGITRAWRRQPDGSCGITDATASERLLLEWEAPDVQGIVSSVDGEPYAVIAGYPLSENCFDFSLLKEKSRLSGLSVYSRHVFAAFLPETYTLINAEDDLGIEGLRMMKRLMRPIGQLKQYEGKAIAHEI